MLSASAALTINSRANVNAVIWKIAFFIAYLLLRRHCSSV